MLPRVRQCDSGTFLVLEVDLYERNSIPPLFGFSAPWVCGNRSPGNPALLAGQGQA